MVSGTVSVTTFSTTFQLNWGSSGQGMCFVIQNNPPAYTSASNAINWSGGPTVIGAARNGLGYGGLNAVNGTPGQSFGLLNSVAVVFNQLAIGAGDPANGVGVYTDGANPFGSQTASGLSFVGSFNVTLSYNGTVLSISIQSTSGGPIFTHNWTVNIPLDCWRKYRLRRLHRCHVRRGLCSGNSVLDLRSKCGASAGSARCSNEPAGQVSHGASTLWSIAWGALPMPSNWR
jgi:hypothetical protein